jgi:hypothetical protein
MVGKLLFVVGILGLLAGAPAQNPVPPQKVNVTLVVILASDQGTTVDQRLTAIADEVRTKNPSLTNFQLKSMTSKALAVNDKAVLPLVEDKDVTITIKQGTDKDKKICVAVAAPAQGEIVYQCVCDKFLPICTRYQTKNKEKLILAIRVQTCKE